MCVIVPSSPLSPQRAQDRLPLRVRAQKEGHFQLSLKQPRPCTGVRYYLSQSPVWTLTSEDSKGLCVV